MQTDGSNAESIFPESEESYEDRVEFCNYEFKIEPRPYWITTEFGGHVGIWPNLKTIQICACIVMLWFGLNNFGFLCRIFTEF